MPDLDVVRVQDVGLAERPSREMQKLSPSQTPVSSCSRAGARIFLPVAVSVSPLVSHAVRNSDPSSHVKSPAICRICSRRPKHKTKLTGLADDLSFCEYVKEGKVKVNEVGM